MPCFGWCCSFAGALVFVFPFYYMLIGSLQEEPDSDLSGALPSPANLTLENYRDINGSIDLPGSLLNSTILTIGVLTRARSCSVSSPAMRLAVLHFRGRGAAFASVLLVQTIPFQLLMIPLYVLLVRDYGFGDTYIGMILPFAINSTAVFIFRQFFLPLPRELFDAARIDGASESASCGASPSPSSARRSSRRPCSRSSARGTNSSGRS